MKSIKQQIADEVGVSPRHLDYIAAGRRNASLRAAIALSNATNSKARIWLRGGNKAKRRHAFELEIKKRIAKL